MKQTVYALLMTSALALPASAATMHDAIDAYGQGQTAQAAAIFGELASAGNARAQYNLALLFFTGEGVPQNYEEAYRWAWSSKLQGVAQSETLIAKVVPSVSKETRQSLASTFSDQMIDRINGGDGRAMIAMSMIVTELAPKPDPIAAYVWQSLAVAVGMDRALPLRDRTFAALSARDQVKAQQQAHRAFADWCEATTVPVPSCQVF